MIIGGSSAFSWVNIDGGVFHHNVVSRPGQWIARILNENQGQPIVDTQNGQLHDNRIVYNDTATEFSTAVNVGPETLSNSYTFARNQWLNLANPTPAGATPNLPVPETGGTYGVGPAPSTDAPSHLGLRLGQVDRERQCDAANRGRNRAAIAPPGQHRRRWHIQPACRRPARWRLDIGRHHHADA